MNLAAFASGVLITSGVFLQGVYPTSVYSLLILPGLICLAASIALQHYKD